MYVVLTFFCVQISQEPKVSVLIQVYKALSALFLLMLGVCFMLTLCRFVKGGVNQPGANDLFRLPGWRGPQVRQACSLYCTQHIPATKFLEPVVTNMIETQNLLLIKD